MMIHQQHKKFHGDFNMTFCNTDGNKTLHEARDATGKIFSFVFLARKEKQTLLMVHI